MRAGRALCWTFCQGRNPVQTHRFAAVHLRCNTCPAYLKSDFVYCCLLPTGKTAGPNGLKSVDKNRCFYGYGNVAGPASPAGSVSSMGKRGRRLAQQKFFSIGRGGNAVFFLKNAAEVRKTVETAAHVRLFDAQQGVFKGTFGHF